MDLKQTPIRSHSCRHSSLYEDRAIREPHRMMEMEESVKERAKLTRLVVKERLKVDHQI